jgi:hypothetical protein
MSKSDWLRFYHAVDEFLPDLMERLAHHFGKFTEQQQQVPKVHHESTDGQTNV